MQNLLSKLFQVVDGDFSELSASAMNDPFSKVFKNNLPVDCKKP